MKTKFEKIVVFDLFGALAANNYKLPEGTITFLQKLHKKGIGLGLVATRSLYSTKKVLPKAVFDLFDFVATSNGARVDYEGKTTEIRMPLADLDHFFGSRYVTAAHNDSTLYINDHRAAKKLMDKFLYKNFKDISELNEDVLSIKIFFDNVADRDGYYEKNYRGENKTWFDIQKILDQYIVITAKEAARENVLLQHLRDKEIYYVGYSHQDLDLFKNRTLNMKKIAPKDALPEIKKLANIVLDKNSNEALDFEI